METQPPPQNGLPVTNTGIPIITAKKLTLIPLIFLIFFEVSGGPYGIEPAVKAAGPLYAILGFIIFPFVWSIPEALITGELSTTFPGNGGYVLWADKAFGPFWGSMMGTLKFLSGVINMAAIPAMCIEYMKKRFPSLNSRFPRNLIILFSTILLSFLNYSGLHIVGYFSVGLGIITLLPFIIMSVISIPQIHSSRLISLGQHGVKIDFTFQSIIDSLIKPSREEPRFMPKASLLNTLFWNLNFWDYVSTMAGEVHKPQKTFPLALFCAVIFICLGYLIPLIAVMGAVEFHQSDWETRFMADAGEMISGKWLTIWIEIGAVLSSTGLFEAQLSSCAYQLEGQADLKFLPLVFTKRSKWFDTPWVGILVSTVIAIGVSYCITDTNDVVASANFLYSLGMLLEFAAFLWLRKKHPELKRPYKVPFNMLGLVIMCLVPSGFLLFMMELATKCVFLVSGLMVVAAIGWYFLMKLCKTKKWLKFSRVE